MTDCPKCGSTRVVKAGRETLARKGPVQRRHCNACGYTWRQKIHQGVRG